MIDEKKQTKGQPIGLESVSKRVMEPDLKQQEEEKRRKV